mgnify:CR=1 FL=1
MLTPMHMPPPGPGFRTLIFSYIWYQFAVELLISPVTATFVSCTVNIAGVASLSQLSKDSILDNMPAAFIPMIFNCMFLSA